MSNTAIACIHLQPLILIQKRTKIQEKQKYIMRLEDKSDGIGPKGGFR